jgi:cobalt-zinc-cadmium efflux system outer membrane protein
MRWLPVLMLGVAAGCQVCRARPCGEVEPLVAAVAAAKPVPEAIPCIAPSPPESQQLDLPSLWNLALRHNPVLREAAARLAASRGRQLQATLYPNPQLAYEQESLGTSSGPPGAIRVVLTQEIVTGGKRWLDIAVAARETDAAGLALLGQTFDVLTRIRRAYADYLAWQRTVGVNEEVVKVLERGKEITRQLVETARTRPRSDLLRVEALLEEARINLQQSRISRQAAWRQLATEVGVLDLPPPTQAGGFPEPAGEWADDAVLRRVLTVHTDIKQAAVQVARSRLALERARAEVVPNVTVGGGYSRNFPEKEAGAALSVQTRLPLWDRNQGAIRAARANLAQSQAALRSTALRLSRDTADALARYQTARHQLNRLTGQVLPRVRESVTLIQEGYSKGAAQYTFADVLSAQQSLNDTELRVAQTRRELWRAVADLEGLMQLDVGEELNGCPGREGGRCRPLAPRVEAATRGGSGLHCPPR